MTDPITTKTNELADYIQLFDKKIFTGVSGANTIRLLPPLCLSKSDASSFLVSFKEVIQSALIDQEIVQQ